MTGYGEVVSEAKRSHVVIVAVVVVVAVVDVTGGGRGKGEEIAWAKAFAD
jgi:hypothetical protein